MSGGQAQKKQSFLQGVAVLTAATIIVKLLGFIYKVPLQNILQERGFGYFNTAYDVYNVLLMISTTGLPVAVSRMISQAQALDNYAQIRKIYSVSMKVFLTIGVVGTLIMLVSALAGREHILNAYKIAVENRYRFFSFGDAMFIADGLDAGSAE